jgi:hypothetical protein
LRRIKVTFSMEKRSYAQPERPAISAAAIEMAYLTSSFCKTEKACFVLLLMASSTATEVLRPQGSGASKNEVGGDADASRSLKG